VSRTNNPVVIFLQHLRHIFLSMLFIEKEVVRLGWQMSSGLYLVKKVCKINPAKRKEGEQRNAKDWHQSMWLARDDGALGQSSARAEKECG